MTTNEWKDNLDDFLWHNLGIEIGKSKREKIIEWIAANPLPKVSGTKEPTDYKCNNCGYFIHVVPAKNDCPQCKLGHFKRIIYQDSLKPEQ